MDIGAITSLLSTGGFGTRIPEELMGLPSRSDRYYRTYSMDAITPVTRNTTSAAVGTDQTNGASDATSRVVSSAAAQAIDAAEKNGEIDTTFREYLEEAMKAATKTISEQNAANYLNLYQTQLMMGGLSPNLTSSLLTTTGAYSLASTLLGTSDDTSGATSLASLGLL